MGFFDRFRSATRPPTGAGDAEAEKRERDAQASRLVDEGNELSDQGRLDEALQRYQAAIRLAPGMARAYLNLGNLRLAGGDVQAALDAYATALTHNPDYAAAHYNKGNANARLGLPQVARACYEQALKLKPDFVDAEVALGNTQDDLRLLDDALSSYGRALRIRPDYAQVYYNLGNVQRKLGRLDEAAQSCRRALELDPGLAEAHRCLGGVMQEQRNWPEALASFRRAMAAQGDLGAAQLQAYHCANHMCDWSNRQADEEALAGMIARGVPGIAPFGLLSLQPSKGDAALLLRQASLRFAEHTLAGYLAHPPLVDPRRHVGQRRLRIGYLSADFHEHATMHLLQGVLAGHDRSKFAITAYSYGSTRDAVTQQASQTCEVFRNLAELSDAAAAATIAKDDIDILVDLKGYTQNTRLEISAQRPAPVIVSWLGYPGTLGHPALADYLVGDPVVTPPHNAAHFSETLALMPHCYQPNDDNKAIGAKPGRTQAGLPAAGFVFCSFNQSYKFNPESFDVWCRLLAQVPGSVLWLLATSEAVVANLVREAAARGIAADRLIFCPTMPLAEHLGRLQLAGLALDTFPYNSHTTGSDALWAGVPLVTRMGSTFASRVAASLLRAAGAPDLVTQDWEGYFSLAKSLALDPHRLSEIRRRLVEARSSAALFDTARFTRDLERLYERIWEQHANGIREIIVMDDADS